MKIFLTSAMYSAVISDDMVIIELGEGHRALADYMIIVSAKSARHILVLCDTVSSLVCNALI